MAGFKSKYTQEFLNKAHIRSSSHKDEILSGSLCGCFYCQQTYMPYEIVEWIDEPGTGETAVCPKCRIDSVLSSDLPILDKAFLEEMHRYWFS